MRGLSNNETREWCLGQGLSLTSDNYLYYDFRDHHSFYVELAGKAQELISLGEYLIPTWNETHFQGGLVWMKDWGIWNEHLEKVGSAILRQMRLASSESRPLIDAPAMLFEPSELFELHAYFALPLLFGWDAFVVPAGREYFVFLSHEGLICVVSKSRQVHEQVFARVKEWGPTENEEWYFRHIVSTPGRE